MTPVSARKRKWDSILAALDIILTSPTNIKSIVLKNLKKDILLDLVNLSSSAMSKEELKRRIKMHGLYVVRKATGLENVYKGKTNQGLQACVPS